MSDKLFLRKNIPLFDNKLFLNFLKTKLKNRKIVKQLSRSVDKRASESSDRYNENIRFLFFVCCEHTLLLGNEELVSNQ